MSDTDRIGFVLDRRYRLKRKIARGSGGTVFEATHLFMKRTVAVKLLAPEHRRIDQYRMRLLREAEVLSLARHPGIVQVLDAGEVDDIGPYLVMELLEGRTLEGILTTKQRIGVAESLHVARQICHALAAAHARGVIHRDIKPSNVFVARDEFGREIIKIFDFGVARAESADRKLTMHGAVVGTPEYMSPEQLLAKEDIDGRVDVYSVGILLYECLTGGVPFDGTFGEILLKTSLQPAPAIRTKNAAIPVELAAAIDKAIARRPDERFPTMQALLDALMQIRLPEAARPLLGLRLPGATDAMVRLPRPPGVPPPLPPGAFASASHAVTIPTGILRDPATAGSLTAPLAGAASMTRADGSIDGAGASRASGAGRAPASGETSPADSASPLGDLGTSDPVGPAAASVPMLLEASILSVAASAPLAAPARLPAVGSISGYSQVLNSRAAAGTTADTPFMPSGWSAAAAAPAPGVQMPRHAVAEHIANANLPTPSGDSLDSRRRFARAPYITPVRILRPDQKKLDGHSEDVSAGGMLVVLSGSCTADEVVKARFALPVSGVIVEVTAYTKWVRTARGIEAMGLQFTAISPEIQSEIEKYVQAMGGA